MKILNNRLFTETKKIIHTLEDEQKAEQDLSAKKSAPISQATNEPLRNSHENELQFDEPAKEEKIVHFCLKTWGYMANILLSLQ